MKPKIILFILLISALIVPTASAYTFINIYIDETGKATFLGETDETPTLPDTIGISNGEIIGTTHELTSKEGDTWTFTYSPTDIEFNIILPEGAVIKNLSQGEIYLISGKISIYSNEEIEIIYTIEDVPQGLNPLANLPLIIILVIAVVVLIVFLINYSKRENDEPKKEDKDKIESISHMLSDREKLILEKLKKVGKTKSSHLRKLTEIPKASFSRHVQELERKKLITRTGEGKNKIIELRD